MKKKILILSTAYPLAGTTFNLITASMWLNKYKLRIDKNDSLDINIRLLPNPKVYTIYSFLKTLLSFPPSVLLNFILKALNFFLDNKNNKNKNLKKIILILKKILSQKKLEKNKNSFFNNIFKGKKYLINYNNYQMNIGLYKFNYLIKNFLLFTAIIKSLRLYFSNFKNLKFQTDKFLTLKYSNVNIGDLVASFTLRTHATKFGGELKNSFQLFFNLTRGIYYCELSDHLDLKNYNEVYIISTEPWYIHEIWTRKLILKNNVKIIDIHNRFDEYKIVDNLEHKKSNYEAPIPNVHNNSKEVYENYFKNKLFNPEKVVDTFLEKNFSNDNMNDRIFDIYDNEINISSKKINSIIFTPNYDDAQYSDGYEDRFTSTYEWTTFTIDHCLLNDEIEKVYIKTHPNIDIINYPGNFIANKKLIKRYLENKKVIFLRKNSSIVLLSKQAKFYGFTRSGTIAEEMTYLGQPMIGWKNGPWINNYNFLKCWHEKNDYKEIIMKLNLKNWSPPSKEQISDLILYINNYAIYNIGLQKKTVRLSLSENIFYNKNLNHMTYENNLSNVEFNSKTFLNIVHYLYNQHLK